MDFFNIPNLNFGENPIWRGILKLKFLLTDFGKERCEMTTEIDARRRSDSWDGSNQYLMWFLSKVIIHPPEEIDESPN